MTDLAFIRSKENLIFLGSVGTGKTHLASALALKACYEGKNVRFFTASAGQHPDRMQQQRDFISVHEYVKENESYSA